MAFEFEITKHIKTLSTNPKGWSKEFNMVSWNKREPKYDIREWDENHEKMGKGVTFTEEEIQNLIEGLNEL